MSKHRKNKCKCGNEKNYNAKNCRKCADRQHSIRMKGSSNPFYRKTHTKKTRRKISQTLKNLKKKPFTKIHKENLSKSKLGKKNPMYGLKDILNPNYGNKKSEECRKKMSLIRGGTGIPYELTEYGEDFDNALKEQVRFRDQYKCQICNCSQLENGRQLDVHHIDYNKRNNNINNLISLCISCNSKVNYNRKFWKNILLKKTIKIYEVRNEI